MSICSHSNDNMYVKVAYDSFNNKRRYDDDNDDRKACNHKKVCHEPAGNSRRPKEETF